MNKHQHRVFGAASWAALTFATGQPAVVIGVGAGLAAATSGGFFSPDIDQFKIWNRILNSWPGRVDDLLFGHRRISHWWGLPAVAALLLDLAPVYPAWPYWALILGWTSHLVGDAVFGKAGFDIPKGIPFLPFTHHVGLGLKSGGLINSVFVVVFAAATVWMMAGGPT